MDNQASPAFDKYPDGLVPAIVQHAYTHQVLMLGYVNEESWAMTLANKQVTFFSRSKQRLWTKGETTGHFLNLVDWRVDCDQDAILLLVDPIGPTCHTGSVSCFGTAAEEHFLHQLEAIIKQRMLAPPEESYTARLVAKGVHKVAQKVGEEGVEVVIEALRNDVPLLLNESADLLYHLLVLLQVQGVSLSGVERVLHERHAAAIKA
jgi:phosphoribosyl-ATP pyrophosphohydrolase/phosphoribosyl-AMP cyclohydrolase